MKADSILHRLFERVFCRGTSLAELGYPSLDELASVGLTGLEFYRRYVTPHRVAYRGVSIRALSRRILADFHRDFPQLAARAVATTPATRLQ